MLNEIMDYVPLIIDEHHLSELKKYQNEDEKLYNKAEKFSREILKHPSRSEKIILTRRGISYNGQVREDAAVKLMLGYITYMQENHNVKKHLPHKTKPSKVREMEQHMRLSLH